MTKIIRSPSRLYRSPDIKTSTRKRSRVFGAIPIISEDKERKKQDYRDRQWETKYFELKNFKAKLGHCDVPGVKNKNNKYYSLGRWCTTQRTVRKFNPLKYAPDRIEKLNALGFSWGIRDTRFERNFNQLKKFREKYGHCSVTETQNKVLANWCVSLRRRRKEKVKALTTESIRRLTKLGFAWYDEKAKNELLWEEQFARLKEFKTKYGHCNVTRIHNNRDPQYILSNWVGTQRWNYRKKRKGLTADRIAKLNSMGFKWVNPFKVGKAGRMSDAALLNDLKRLYALRGSPPSIRYVEKYGMYSRKAYCTHFGSIAKARKLAGIYSPIIYLRRNKYSDLELLNDLKRLNVRLGEAPSERDLNKYGKYSYQTYYTRFGSYSEAIKRAGLERVTVARKRISDEELLNDLKRLFKQRKQPPTPLIIAKYGKYGITTYGSRFGSIKKARKIAGLPVKWKKPNKYSDEVLLNELKRLSNTLKKTPSHLDIRRKGKYSVPVYQRRFGSIIKARKKAGIHTFTHST